MASLNKVQIDTHCLIELYSRELSITDISKMVGVPQSTIRFRLKRAGVLRNRDYAVRLAATQGKLGRKNPIECTDKMLRHIREMVKDRVSNAKGTSVKPNGYIEYTTGENKFRSVHDVLIEKALGIKLCKGECVHHIDEIRSNNELSNLLLMSRAEHSRLHIEGRMQNRNKKTGRFIENAIT